MNKIYKILMPGLILIAICVITVGLVYLANYITKDKIEEQDINTTNKLMRTVIETDNFKETTDNYSGKDNSVLAVYDAFDGENNYLGSIFIVGKNGYGGVITIMTGIGADGKIIKVNAIDVSTETPGLGQKTAENDFTEQYIGKDSHLTVGENIDAQTGATISSKAVTEAVNTALELYKERAKSANE